MSDYRLLGPDERRAVLNDRLLRAEADHYRTHIEIRLAKQLNGDAMADLVSQLAGLTSIIALLAEWLEEPDA